MTTGSPKHPLLGGQGTRFHATMFLSQEKSCLSVHALATVAILPELMPMLLQQHLLNLVDHVI